MKPAISFLIRLAIACLLVFGIRGAKAATQITGYVTITNTPAGLTTNIVVNIGAADTRNWTNSAAGAPSTSIQITNSTAASASNLVAQLSAYPVYSAGAGTPQLLATLNATNTSVVNLYAPENTNITVTFGGLWAYVVYVTNTFADGVSILNRTNSMSSTARTNAENAIINLLAQNRPTNAVPINSTFLRNYTDTNTAQTIGNKTLIGPVISGGRATTITNLTATNVFLTNVTLRLVTATGADLTGLITLLSNGTIYATVLDGVRPTNVFGLAGAVHQVIGGHWTNGSLHSASGFNSSFSNSTLYGGTTLTGASVNLVGSGANNFISLTATSTTAAVGAILYTSRENGITNAVDAGDVLGIIGFTGYGETGQRVGARIRAIPMETFTDSTAGTIFLIETTPSGNTTPVGRLHIGDTGFVTVSNVLQVLAGITNTATRGTNTYAARMDLVPRANSALANGYNSDVVLGTNVYIRLSGPSGAYTNVGFRAAAAVDGTFHVVQADNPGLSFTILDSSGLDATAANRILTGTGALKSSTNNPVIFKVIYDGNASRWRVFDWPPN